MAQLNIIPAETIQHRLAGIIWGDSKVGKTTWAMSLPGRKLLISTDPDGFLAVSNRSDFDLLDLSILTPTEAISQAKGVATYLVENADKYQSVILDSLTTLTALALQDAITRGVGKGKEFTPTLEAPGLVGYGARNTTVVDILSKLLRATGINKQHCFFIAHADDPEFDAKGENIVQQTIMLSAKIRNNSALRVSDLYYLGLASGNRRTVYLAPFGVLKPMGSRIFDTTKVPRFDLKYSSDIPDTDQKDSLASIIATFRAGNTKLIKGPHG